MTETNESALESVKTIKFTGDEKKWREWHKKVEAYAKVKGFHEALLDNNGTGVTEKMRNNALNFLTMCLCGTAFAFVEDATDAAQVWKELKEEYSPSEDIDVYTLQEEFLRCKLTSDLENPVHWFKRLEHINSRLSYIDASYKKSDEDLKIHIKVHLPSKYYSELLTTTRRTFRAISLKDFKKEIKAHWRSITERKVNKDGNEETVLNTSAKRFYKQFKGQCRICGEFGHKAKFCPNRKPSGNRKGGFDKSKVKCYKCKKYGHYANECKANVKKEHETSMFVGHVRTNGYVFPKGICKECKVVENVESTWTQVTKEELKEKDMHEDGEIAEDEEGKKHDINEDIDAWIKVPEKRRKVTSGDSFEEKVRSEKAEERRHNNMFAALASEDEDLEDEDSDEEDLPLLKHKVNTIVHTESGDESIERLFAPKRKAKGKYASDMKCLNRHFSREFCCGVPHHSKWDCQPMPKKKKKKRQSGRRASSRNRKPRTSGPGSPNRLMTERDRRRVGRLMINAEIEMYAMELESKVKVSVEEFHRRIARLTKKFDVNGGYPNHWAKTKSP